MTPEFGVWICVKSLPADELFTICRNWLALGEAVPPESVKPEVAKHQHTDNK